MSSSPECPVLIPLVVIKSIHLSRSYLLLFISKARSQLPGSSAPPYHTHAHSHTCTCVTMHTIVHACIMNISMHIHNHAHSYADTCCCSCVHMCIHIFTTTQHTHMNTCPHVWVLKHAHTCGYLEVCKCAHTHQRAFPNTHTCKYACTAIHIRNCRLSAGNLSSSEEILLVRR